MAYCLNSGQLNIDVKLALNMNNRAQLKLIVTKPKIERKHELWEFHQDSMLFIYIHQSFALGIELMGAKHSWKAHSFLN